MVELLAMTALQTQLLEFRLLMPIIPREKVPGLLIGVRLVLLGWKLIMTRLPLLVASPPMVLVGRLMALLLTPVPLPIIGRAPRPTDGELTKLVMNMPVG